MKGGAEVSDATGGLKCPHCQKEFPNEHGLKVHVARMHRDKFESSDKRPWRKARVEHKVRGKLLPAPVAAQVTRPQPPAATVNFCPHCGLPIAIVAQAMTIAKGVSGG